MLSLYPPTTHHRRSQSWPPTPRTILPATAPIHIPRPSRPKPTTSKTFSAAFPTPSTNNKPGYRPQSHRRTHSTPLATLPDIDEDPFAHFLSPITDDEVVEGSAAHPLALAPAELDFETLAFSAGIIAGGEETEEELGAGMEAGKETLRQRLGRRWKGYVKKLQSQSQSQSQVQGQSQAQNQSTGLSDGTGVSWCIGKGKGKRAATDDDHNADEGYGSMCEAEDVGPRNERVPAITVTDTDKYRYEDEREYDNDDTALGLARTSSLSDAATAPYRTVVRTPSSSSSSADAYNAYNYTSGADYVPYPFPYPGSSSGAGAAGFNGPLNSHSVDAYRAWSPSYASPTASSASAYSPSSPSPLRASWSASGSTSSYSPSASDSPSSSWSSSASGSPTSSSSWDSSSAAGRPKLHKRRKHRHSWRAPDFDIFTVPEDREVKGEEFFGGGSWGW